MVNIRSSAIENGNHTHPRIILPELKFSYNHDGYLLGNRNGRSIYNIILEGICATAFTLTLLYSLYHLDLTKNSSTGKGIKDYSWHLLFWIPLLKNVFLLLDFYQLFKTKKYNWYSLVILVSNIVVWGSALHNFDVNYKLIFINLENSAKGLDKPLQNHTVTGLFFVLVIDDYIQILGLMHFLYLVYKNQRIIDFYRDYSNPLNFCISCSMNGILSSIVSQKTNKFVWITNFSLTFFIAGYFLIMYVTYLYKLCATTCKRNKQPISSKIIIKKIC